MKFLEHLQSIIDGFHIEFDGGYAVFAIISILLCLYIAGSGIVKFILRWIGLIK